MKNKLLILAAIFLIVFSASSFSQRSSSEKKAPSGGVMTGKIFDSETVDPLPYANIIVYSASDSSIVTGAYSEENGTFRIENIPYGRYYAKVQYIGYESRTVKNMAVKRGAEKIEIGDVGLRSSSVQAEEVEVRADRKKVVYALDKKIVNVSQDIISSGGSAVEALERAPSIQVDIEGNVTLRGSSNFTVFINGKPSVLQSSDALQQIPASSIDHIELITNPSVKYDPDGLAGIINIVLKDDSDLGLHGQTSLMAGMGDKYKGDIMMNWNFPDLKILASANYSRFSFKGEGLSREERYYDDDTTIFNSDLNGRHLRGGWNVKTGVEYEVSDMLTMKIEGSAGSHLFERSNKGDLFNLRDAAVYTQSRSTVERNSHFYSTNYNLTYDFDEKGQKLDFLAFYSYDEDDGDDNQSEYFTDAEWNDKYEQSSGIESSEDGVEDEFRFQVDYTLPVDEKTKFEAGAQARLTDEQEWFDFYKLDTLTGEMQYDDTFSNTMDFKRHIYAGYATWASEIFGIGYQLGLRAEYTDRQVGFSKAENDFIIDRVDWFPSVHTSYKFNEETQIMASYSRRINRPRGYFLEPFPTYRDTYNYRVGDPEIEPEYTDSYELGWQKYLGDFSFTIEGYFRSTENEFERIRTLDSNGVMRHTLTNLSSSDALGVEVMLNYAPYDWLNLNLVPNFFYNTISGDILEEDAATSTKTWDLRFYADIKAYKDLRFEIKSFFRGPSLTAQGEREAAGAVDLGVRYDFMQRAASLTLSARDIFDSRFREMTSSSSQFYTYDKFNRESQIFMLTFTYRFNPVDRDRRNGAGGGDNDIDMEMF